MDHSELTTFFLALGVLLLAARVFGELARSMNFPAVLGELMAGILLGPTILGALSPDLFSALFPESEGFQIGLQAVTSLGITLFLMVAGIEVDLSTILRQGRASMVISTFGMLIPFAIGFLCAYFFPVTFGAHESANPVYFALFLGTALSITALPVIAKILIDLNMYRSDLGMILISVAVINDLVGWLLFAVILGLLHTTAAQSMSIGMTIGMTIGFTLLMLTLGRFLVNAALPRIQAYTSWPGGVLGFAVIGGLLAASFTEWIGIHSILGAFMFGVALGDSKHLREKTRHILDHFISFIFAPLFFASIGLRINILDNFNPFLIVLVLVIATVGKLLGSHIACKIIGFTKRDSLTIGMATNARGAMEIILALLALEAGLIQEDMFVALIIMAIVTSIVAGPLMQRVMRHKRPPRLIDFLSSRSYIANLDGLDKDEVIRELSQSIAPIVGFEASTIEHAVIERERSMATGIGNKVAIPHARIEGLTTPAIALGITRQGVDFDAPDGVPANVILLVLTPRDDFQLQLQLLADIARTFRNEKTLDRILQTSSFVELLGMLRSEETQGTS